jgi:pyruvate formate-lyase activating enzyme-like uncharacterized protein
MTEEILPPFLHHARECAKKRQYNNDLNDLVTKWKLLIEKISESYPEVIYDPRTELLSMGDLSPGCLICRLGGWECIFVTQKCNLNCSFCYSQNKQSPSFSGSDFKNNAHQMPLTADDYNIQGVSFTGGEALLEIDKLYSLIQIATQNPNIKHTWLYTNGLLLNDEILTTLARLGLDEIRFNAAATNYHHSYVLKMMKKASDLFDWVTVEIPLISSDFEVLLESLSVWIDHGVKTLNLHELLFEPGSNSENFDGDSHEIFLPDGHKTAIDPNYQTTAFEVLQNIHFHSLDLSVNFCSTIGKWKQLTARREFLLEKTIQPFENYLGDGVLESFYTIERNQVRALFETREKLLNHANNHERLFRLTRMAPLSLNEKQENWLTFEALT